MEPGCATCDTAAVELPLGRRTTLDPAATIEALSARVAAGRMRVLRGDVPLADMLPLASSDLKYTIASFLECLDCGRTRFWGLCIRGEPSYRVVDRRDVARWPWEPVPARERWAPAAGESSA